MKYLSIFISLLFSISSQASVIVNSTRVIYPAEAKFVNVQLVNRGNTTHLVQSWIDDGNASDTPEKIKVPFVLTPPVVKMKGGDGQALKIVGRGVDALPKDRESVFWLNVVDIPPQPEANSVENYLQVAIRTRIKLFFRPAGLTKSPSEAIKRLSLQHDGSGSCMKNDTPYYMTIVHMAPWRGGELKQPIKDNLLNEALFVAPYSCLSIPAKVNQGSKYRISYLDDFGARRFALL
ncbi:fimbrial biogenesis chaperone [Aeromonas simiae]|uniref:fimbrial biogenesis chaperone n=1 Tax=Aeromonas simiae TaxID=218936 RepID=UPI0005A69657|nr:fimbria/pilus periplasmic chaperone [Aeromonas simiae]